MSDGMKLGLWGALAVVLFGGILLVQTAFGGLVEAADRGGDSGAGMILLAGTVVLAGLVVFALAMFFSKLAAILQKRHEVGHANS